MLPLFGKVKSFLMTQKWFVANRPVPPYLQKSEQFAKELAEVKEYGCHQKNMQIVTFFGLMV
jgi:hypothetical protein